MLVYTALSCLSWPTPAPSTLWVPPQLTRFCADCLQWVSLILSIYRQYRCISLMTCAGFPVSYIVLMFHEPIRRDLVDCGGICSALFFFRLELLNFMHSFEETPSSPKMWRWFLLVLISVTSLLIQVGWLAPGQSGGPGCSVSGAPTLIAILSPSCDTLAPCQAYPFKTGAARHNGPSDTSHSLWFGAAKAIFDPCEVIWSLWDHHQHWNNVPLVRKHQQKYF